MAAFELSRTFDPSAGRVVVEVKDDLGNRQSHSIYVTGPTGVSDVNAAIAQILTETDALTDTMKARFAAAGWVPSSGG